MDVTEERWMLFERRLKWADWYYQYSDDHSAFKRGQHEISDLVLLRDQLAKADKDRAETLWRINCPYSRKEVIIE